MSKQEVIETIGEPSSTSTRGGTEFLPYRFMVDFSDVFFGSTYGYYVALVNGSVTEYLITYLPASAFGP